jgi:hypothetical protein
MEQKRRTNRVTMAMAVASVRRFCVGSLAGD